MILEAPALVAAHAVDALRCEQVILGGRLSQRLIDAAHAVAAIELEGGKAAVIVSPDRPAIEVWRRA